MTEVCTTVFPGLSVIEAMNAKDDTHFINLLSTPSFIMYSELCFSIFK